MTDDTFQYHRKNQCLQNFSVHFMKHFILPANHLTIDKIQIYLVFEHTKILQKCKWTKITKPWTYKLIDSA